MTFRTRRTADVKSRSFAYSILDNVSGLLNMFSRGRGLELWDVISLSSWDPLRWLYRASQHQDSPLFVPPWGRISSRSRRAPAVAGWRSGTLHDRRPRPSAGLKPRLHLRPRPALTQPWKYRWAPTLDTACGPRLLLQALQESLSRFPGLRWRLGHGIPNRIPAQLHQRRHTDRRSLSLRNTLGSALRI